GRFLAVRFNLSACVERDLLIRKLFTAGLDATTVNASAFSSTGALLTSIWATRRRSASAELPVAPPPPEEKLPAQSLVIHARSAPPRLADLAAQRAIAA